METGRLARPVSIPTPTFTLTGMSSCVPHPPGQAYVVGGAVRDALLGLPVKDRDWVVVGSTAADMLAQGFRAVGKDFPVFLHPHTQEDPLLCLIQRQEYFLGNDLIRRIQLSFDSIPSFLTITVAALQFLNR